MFDNLLQLKEKLEMELPFMFVMDLDPSHFATDVVFKEPHLPPIRGRQNYQLFSSWTTRHREFALRGAGIRSRACHAPREGRVGEGTMEDQRGLQEPVQVLPELA